MPRPCLPYLWLWAVVTGCSEEPPAAPPPPAEPPHQLAVLRPPDGTLVLRMPAADFSLDPGGHLRAALRSGGRDLHVGAGALSTIEVAGREVRFALDLGAAQEESPPGRPGLRLRVEGRSAEAPLRQHLALEVRAHAPDVALLTVTYQNRGKRPLPVGRVRLQRHLLGGPLWSLQTAPGVRSRNEVLRLGPGFSRGNLLGASGRFEGGGFPLLALWTAAGRLALGSLDRLLVAPVAVDDAGQTEANVEIVLREPMRPGQLLEFPTSFLMPFRGNHHTPLRALGQALWSRRPPAPPEAGSALLRVAGAEADGGALLGQLAALPVDFTGHLLLRGEPVPAPPAPAKR